ncbi:hypothetical protein THIARS_60989 [Thiomonas delicata]|uniref:Uncharacterized protein n=1 Tax=Thiomonas delicata TaxID=364030 RepID=A0A238D4Q4_THIDL|nr:hypothetical protein THIARS_60989 [Thiomonas delicata]
MMHSSCDKNRLPQTFKECNV